MGIYDFPVEDWRGQFFPSNAPVRSESYYLRKLRLMARIQETNWPKCSRCGEQPMFGSYPVLEFHHQGEQRGQRAGGPQMLQEVEQDIEDGNPPRVYCTECHPDNPNHGGGDR